MNLDIDPEWLKRKAEEGGNGILSVGGLVTRQKLLDLNESLVRRYIELDGSNPEEAESLREQIAVSEAMLMGVG